MHAYRLALIAASSVLGACTTTLTHETLVAGAQPAKPGFAYYLPKQRFEILATYELKSCPKGSGTKAEIALPLIIQQSATITETSVADWDAYYSIPLKTLSSGWKTTSFTASTYDNQTLHKVGITAEDATSSVIANTLSTAFSIARIAVGTPTGAKADSDLCTADAYRALTTIKNANEKLKDDNTPDEEKTKLAARINAAKQDLTFSETFKFTPSLTATNSTQIASTSNILKFIKNPALIANASPEGRAQYANIFKTGIRLQAAPAAPGQLPDNLKGAGVIYREPIAAVIEVCSGPCEEQGATSILTLETQIAQLGRTAALPLKNGPFQKNNLSVEFAPNGRLMSVTYGNEARLDKMTKSASDSIASVETFAAARASAKKTDADERAGAELKALQAETALINAKAEKIEAEARLAKLGAGQ